MRVTQVVPGATGYITPEELLCARPGAYPTIRRSMCNSKDDLDSEKVVRVYHKPDGSFLVFVPEGVKAQYDPFVSFSVGEYFSVTMVLDDGTRTDGKIPDGYWQDQQAK